MKILARDLRCGDVIRTQPPTRVDAVKREGLRVIVHGDDGRERTYMMSEQVGIERRLAAGASDEIGQLADSDGLKSFAFNGLDEKSG